MAPSRLVLLSLALAGLVACKDKVNTAPVAPIGDTVKIRLESDPPGAAIELDGKPVAGTTPADLEVPRIGAPQVSLSFRGFESWSGPLEAGSGGEPMRVRLTPLVVVQVTTDPPGAAVTCDGKQVLAESPGRFEVPQGSHALRAEKPGFLPSTAQVAASGAFAKWEPKLDAAGFLTVRANVEGAAILVDSIETGVKTPAEKIPVATGVRVVEAKLGAKVSRPTRVKVAAGKTVTVSLTLADPQETANLKYMRQIEALEATKERLENQLDAERQKVIVKDASKLVRMEEKIQALDTEIGELQSKMSDP